MVISLGKVTRDGKPYQRRRETECLLENLDLLEPDQLVDMCLNPDEIVPFEVLIYYLRHKELALEKRHVEALFKSFYTRIETSLNQSIPDSRVDRARDIREEIVVRIMEKIASDRNTQQDKMYYWEVNFNHAFESFRKDILKQLGPTYKSDPLRNATALSQSAEEGLDVSPEVEAAAAEFFNPNQSKLDDPAFRLRLLAAINDLPDDEKRAVGLILQGIQIESKDPDVMTISKALKCRERTVRNRLSRAYSKLKDALQVEELL
ncbi:MAG: sigma-70 family RNA polymerase sigma factor [Gammaproteobacteria bacterium]|nr:sigma-70 family RNA polymerase sigma factor [Gammaproteobacteria bacterium]